MMVLCGWLCDLYQVKNPRHNQVGIGASSLRFATPPPPLIDVVSSLPVGTNAAALRICLIILAESLEVANERL